MRSTRFLSTRERDGDLKEHSKAGSRGRVLYARLRSRIAAQPHEADSFHLICLLVKGRGGLPCVAHHQQGPRARPLPAEVMNGTSATPHGPSKQLATPSNPLLRACHAWAAAAPQVAPRRSLRRPRARVWAPHTSHQRRSSLRAPGCGGIRSSSDGSTTRPEASTRRSKAQKGHSDIICSETVMLRSTSAQFRALELIKEDGMKL